MTEHLPSPEDHEKLSRPVTVFIASKDTAPTKLRALWRMSASDAMKVCTDPRTAGLKHGLHWTQLGANNPDLWQECFEFVKDDGRYNEVLAELQVRIIGDY